MLEIVRKMDKAVLFDFDWTLAIMGVDWVRLSKRMRLFFKKYGVDFKGNESIKGSYGLARELGKKGYDVEKILSCAHRIIKEEELVGARKTKRVRGSKKLIERLRTRFPLGIVTNNSVEALNVALKKVGLSKKDFGVIITRNARSELKPSPQPILAAIKRLPPAIKVVYMVGDESADILTAKAAGKILKRRKKIVTIGFPGWMGRSALVAAKPDYIIDRLDEIIRILDK
jgi:HAD superfamily hydrolase (TIGR01549 family)